MATVERAMARAVKTSRCATTTRIRFPSRSAVKVKAEQESETQSPSPIAVATSFALPGAAIAASSAALRNGVPDEPIWNYFRATANFVMEAHANGKIPLFLEQWFHAANMAVVLAVMVGYAAYLGWKVRSGDREASTLGPGDDTAGELHPKLMAIAGILMLAGAQGGALFRGLLTGSFLDSEHAKTAIAGLGLLFGQGILGKTMGSNQTARDLHAFLGSTTLAIFVIHAILGVQNALEVPALAASGQ